MILKKLSDFIISTILKFYDNTSFYQVKQLRISQSKYFLMDSFGTVADIVFSVSNEFDMKMSAFHC